MAVFGLCRCGPDGEPTITHYDTEFFKEFRGANSFGELLKGLFFDAGDFVFAIDDPDLPGERLHRRLVALGCRGIRPHDASKQERKKAPHSWKWPAFATDVGEPAHLFVYENGLLDPWTLARPAKHPLLLVHVGRKDQQRCMLRLATEFGDAVVLIHQPAGRPAIRDLPESPPFVPRESTRPTKVDPKTLNAAVRAGDRDLVKALLESGVT